MNIKKSFWMACAAFVIFTVSTSASASLGVWGSGLPRNSEAAERVPLSEEIRKVSGEALSATLVELIDQSRAVQQAHWNVRGELFYSLHDLLGDFYEQLNETIDIIAERNRALGFPADGSPSSVASKSGLGGISGELVSGSAVLDDLTRRYSVFSGRLEERINKTSNDLVTQGMLLELAGMVQKQLWLLRSFYPDAK